MADPFSIGAGVVGVISLTVQITQMAVNLGKEWKDAPDTVRSFIADLAVLKTILSETNTNVLLNPDFIDVFQNQPSSLLSQLGPQAPATTDLKVMLHICENKLKHLLEDLKQIAQGHRLGWDRLKAAFSTKDIRESVRQVSAQCQLLNQMLTIDGAVLAVATHQEIEKGRKEWQEWRQADASSSTLDWLSLSNYAIQQSDFLARRQLGTGEWLLTCAEFHEWLDTDQHRLFCPGIPGAGKTMLTAIVIDHLTRYFAHDSSIGIAYIYFNFQRQDEQEVIELLSSLLKQLAETLPCFPRCVENLYERHKEKCTRPSLNEVSTALQSLISLYSKVFIVIDALDECPTSDGRRSRFISEIFGLQVNNATKLFVTARSLPDIEKEFTGCLTRMIVASDEDIRCYLDNQIQQLPTFILSRPQLQTEIKDGILGAADGMFLLAQLYVDSLKDATRVKDVKIALQQTRKQDQKSKTSRQLALLSHAYDQALSRIEAQSAGFRRLAKETLSWIACALRPLTTWELQHALAIEIDSAELDEDNIPDLETIIAVCAGLVVVDQTSGIIRLVHYTTQEYFDQTRHRWFPNSDATIADYCTTYLSFDHFRNGISPTDEDFEKRLQTHPFYMYATHNWGHHSRKCATTSTAVTTFLNSERHVEAVSQCLLVVQKYRPMNYSQEFERDMTNLHLVALFGVTESVNAILKKKPHINSKTQHGRTSISLAASNGYDSVVEMLLATGEVDIDPRDNNNRTPLSLATSAGHESVVKLLIDTGKVDLNSKDNYGQTPLLHAASSGNEAVLKLLLATGEVDVNSKDETGRTPLSHASFQGHEAVVKQLLQIDKIDLNTSTIDGHTPLMLAAFSGQESTVDLLLANGGIDLNCKDIQGRTLLYYATCGGNEDIVGKLLAIGKADIESESVKNWTLFSIAAAKGYTAIVKILLTTGKVDVNSKDNNGRTPLLVAASKGHTAIIKLLLATGNVDVNSKDNTGQTPLLLAVSNKHDNIIELLLETGFVDVNSRDNIGRTPLVLAASSGPKAVVKLLLAVSEVDVNAKDDHGQTALSITASNGHEAMVELLLATGKVDVNSKNNNGRTPLSLAASGGHQIVVELLLATGKVNVDSKAHSGRTPLSLAASSGHEAVVTLLLATGKVDVNSKANSGRTPLSLAASNGHEAVVKLLLTIGIVDVDPKDNTGQTPLSLAASNGYDSVVELLLATNNVNINSKNNNGRTPLSLAASGGHEAVVELLLATGKVIVDS